MIHSRKMTLPQPRKSLLLISLSLVWPAASLAAQGDCFPGKDSHEAQLFAALAVPLAFGMAQAPQVADRGRIEIAFEGTYLPEINEQTRTPTICRPGKGPEHTDLLFAFPRPRVTVGLPGGFLLEGSWIPPIRINGVRSNLVGVALQRDFPIANRPAIVALRIHGTGGLIRAPITCEKAALRDPTSECFQGTLSDDHYHPNTFGAEGAVSWAFAQGRIRSFVGGGVNILHPRFHVNFTNQFGSTDNRKIEVDLTRGALFGGASWSPDNRFALTGGIYGSPGDDVTGRVLLSYTLRSGS
jgi:hypothetical protein